MQIISVIFFAFLSFALIAFGWYPCCCTGIATACCPSNTVPTTIYGTLSTTCAEFDGITFAMTWDATDSRWETPAGSYGQYGSGEVTATELRLACTAGIWVFTGTFIWTKNDWPDPPACEWWTDPTEGGMCPTDTQVRPVGWDGTSCFIEFMPTYCGTCPDGYSNNGGTGTFYNLCIPCLLSMSVTFNGNADSAACSPLSVVRNRTIGNGGGCPGYTHPCASGTAISWTVTA